MGISVAELAKKVRHEGQKLVESYQSQPILLLLLLLLFLLFTPKSEAQTDAEVLLVADLTEQGLDDFKAFLPAIFVPDIDLPEGLRILGAWSTNAKLFPEYSPEGALLDIGNLQRFNITGELYASNIAPPILESYEELDPIEKAQAQSQYIRLILKAWIPVFWTDFDAVLAPNRTPDEYDPNCWRAYPYDPDRPIDFYRDRILNYYSMLRLLSPEEMQANADLIRQELLVAMGEEEYVAHLDEINAILQDGYTGNVLFLNEPNTELGISSQACRTPRQAAEILVKAKEILPNAKFIGPNAIQQIEEWYLDQFLYIWFEELGRTDIPFVEIGFHVYNHNPIIPSEFIASLRAVLENYAEYFVDENGDRIVVPIKITETGVVELPENYCQGEETYNRFRNMFDPEVAEHEYFPLTGVGPFTHYGVRETMWTHGLLMSKLDDDGTFMITPYGQAIIAATRGLPPDIAGWCVENQVLLLDDMPSSEILSMKLFVYQSELDQLLAQKPDGSDEEEVSEWLQKLHTVTVALQIYTDIYNKRLVESAQ